MGRERQTSYNPKDRGRAFRARAALSPAPLRGLHAGPKRRRKKTEEKGEKRGKAVQELSQPAAYVHNPHKSAAVLVQQPLYTGQRTRRQRR